MQRLQKNILELSSHLFWVQVFNMDEKCILKMQIHPYLPSSQYQVCKRHSLTIFSAQRFVKSLPSESRQMSTGLSGEKAERCSDKHKMPADTHLDPKGPLILTHVNTNIAFPEKLSTCCTPVLLVISRHFHYIVAFTYCITNTIPYLL